MKQHHTFNRRDFLKTSSAVSLAAMFAGSSRAFAGGDDTIRVGFIGTGGRGTGAMADCFVAAKGERLELAAMGDLFPESMEKSLKNLKTKLAEKLPDKKFEDLVKVTPDRMFSGFDACQKVLACDVDMVILAAPPHFRPAHFEAAVAAGKHVFMEKPVAVDPAGIRKMFAASELSVQKKLSVVAGTQRRHNPQYQQIIERIHNGQIGDLVAGQCYWNTDDLWVERAAENWEKYQKGEYSEMEWQIRNWLFTVWMSGDHIVEQHVHNLDIMNWAFGGPPVRCMGMGGRQVRVEPQYGNGWDQFAVEYEYANGAKVLSMCRQTKGCDHRNSEVLVGTKGTAEPKDGEMLGSKEYLLKEEINPYVQEHADLLDSIRNGKGLNEGKQVTESTLTAIMGRMSAYTGLRVKYDWVLKASKLDYTPAAYEFGPHPMDPVAMPGITKLI